MSLNLGIIVASEEVAQRERGTTGTLNIYHVVSVEAEDCIAYVLFGNNTLWPFLFYIIEIHTLLAGLLSFDIYFLALKTKGILVFSWK